MSMSKSSPLRTRPAGMTIGRWMVVALVTALVMTGFRVRSFEPKLELGLGLAIAALGFARLVVLAIAGKRCPACGKGPVGRVAAVPFRDVFYRCRSCGQRMKRYGLGRLWDASGPADDSHFHKNRPVSTWSDGPIEPTIETPATRTVGLLLRDKRDRGAATGEAPEIDLLAGDPTERSSSPVASRPASPGVHSTVAERFFRTLDAIRWTRNSRR